MANKTILALLFWRNNHCFWFGSTPCTCLLINCPSSSGQLDFGTLPHNRVPPGTSVASVTGLMGLLRAASPVQVRSVLEPLPAAQVLTNHGSVERPDLRTCRLPDIKRKMLAKNATTSDLALNQVSGFRYSSFPSRPLPQPTPSPADPDCGTCLRQVQKRTGVHPHRAGPENVPMQQCCVVHPAPVCSQLERFAHKTGQL